MLRVLLVALVAFVPASAVAQEACNCEDDDGDGAVDENRESLCPGGSACVACQCATWPSKFGCPAGTRPLHCDDPADPSSCDSCNPTLPVDCWCIEPECTPANCAEEASVTIDGVTRCAPDRGEEGIPPCACVERFECGVPCMGVECGTGHICDPFTQACVPFDCVTHFCPRDEQVCDARMGGCVRDPCLEAGCEDACRIVEGSELLEARCEASCGDVLCDEGEVCRSGVCEADACAGVTCASGERCDPATGVCATDACADVMCRAGTTCDPATGACAVAACRLLRCPRGQACADGECVAAPPDFDGPCVPNPCGPTETCVVTRDEAGVAAAFCQPLPPPSPCVPNPCRSGERCETIPDDAGVTHAWCFPEPESTLDGGPPRMVSPGGGGGSTCAVGRGGASSPVFFLLALLALRAGRRRSSSP